MAANFNKVFLMGNLTRDPELRYTASGSAVCHFDMATNRRFTGKDGQKREDTCFMRINVWGKSGENCANYLSKGRPVFVEGRLQSRSWQTEDGQKRSAVDVVADSVQFLGSPPGGGGGGGGRPRDDDYPPAEPRGGGGDGGRSESSGNPSDNDGFAPPDDDIPF